MPKQAADPSPPGRIAPLAAAIRRRRRALGLTQIELARFAGCGPDFLYDLEAGKPTIQLAKLLDVLSVLGLGLRLVEHREVLSMEDRLAAPPEATQT